MMDDLYSEYDGRALAVQLLRELEVSDCDDCSIESMWRHGRPQNDAVLRYLDVLRTRNSRALDAGFAAILTDFLARAIWTVEQPQK
jgi:hypothetical protein